MSKFKCDRCKSPIYKFTFSYFNTEMICMNCTDKEKSHPLYLDAIEAEYRACKEGNRNFEGIGLPDDLKVHEEL